MVVGAVHPGCRRRPHHYLVLRAQGRFQGASQGLFLVVFSLGYTGVCVCDSVCVCVCVCISNVFSDYKKIAIPKNLVLNIEQVK